MKRAEIPNLLTAMRLVMTVGVLGCLELAERPSHSLWVWVALGLFVVAALTDALDGYLARRWDVVSRFGRIVDPLADKLLILATAGYLAASSSYDTGVTAWMLAVLLIRELLVTGLRGVVESSGGDFSARWSGKWKMILQSVAIPWAMLGMGLDPEGVSPGWFFVVRDGLLIAMAIITLVSGWAYVSGAARMLRASDQAG
ncbi:MAG: CDP-diacylglycerol--glycerol-3-phosphate 3-phosphatidyltransferase [Phycisphaeraceae bacterium]